MDDIRVLLVDDHSILREGLHSMLESQPGIVVVGEARDGQEALQKAKVCRPEIVIMDISMEGMDGIEATRQFSKQFPQIHVIILTQHNEPTFVDALIAVGASGYVLKREGSASLIQSIRKTHIDGSHFPPSVVRKFIYQRKRTHQQANILTPREKEVLQLIAQGFSGQEIAKQLVLSVKTVSAHRTNIMRKLGVHKSTELIMYALKQGLISL